MSLKVCHIIDGLGIGGAERHLVNVVNAMDCTEKMVVCIGKEMTGPSFQEKLDPSVNLEMVRIRFRNWPIRVVKLASLLRRHRIDVVHTHMYRANLYGGLAAWLAKRPVVVTSEHGENPWKKPYHRWLERNVISGIADIRLCVSQKILDTRKFDDRVPEEKLKLTINGTVLPETERRSDKNDVTIIGSVGRLVDAKDYSGLLRAAAILKSRYYKFQLCLVGDGPEMIALNHLRHELDLDDVVKFVGTVTDVDAYYRKFDIYVSSSKREGLPVALLEAMANRLPIVATDVGACAETICDGEGGIIIPPNSPGILADALARLLDDPILRDKFREAARLRIEKYFSVSRVAQDYLTLYQQILSAKQATQR
jgi:glycosyltransferase involved in cell wall biosynthesis